MSRPCPDYTSATLLRHAEAADDAGFVLVSADLCREAAQVIRREPAPFFSLTDEVLGDLTRRVDDLSPWVCPDVKAKLRAAVADTVRKRAPIHQDAQCQITECFAFPLTRIAQQFDSRPQAFAPTRWEWIAENFASHFDCDPEDIDCDDDNLISVRGHGIVGFVRTRIG